MPGSPLAEPLLHSLFVTMLRIRKFEERTADLVEAKEIRTPTHLCIGQEAVPAGICAALRIDDYILGNHRSHGHYLAKGGPMDQLMAELFGKETGCSRGRGGSMHLYAGSVGLLGTVPMVAATVPIAVGAALAASAQGTGRVAVAFFGDGATEEGAFHEALNFAALRKLPVVFACENNLFSSHLRLSERRPRTDAIHELAGPYGIPGLVVDGNDAVAVYVAAQWAVARARGGEGPTLVEFLTYRWRGHVGPSYDLDVGIREPGELQLWMDRCPIQRLQRELGLSETESEAIRRQVGAEVDASVRFARESPYPPDHELSRHVFVPSVRGG